ncbi:hypothetical protein QAD02_022993 [Eretmocerus hayati]|uniref:Uncharacterized protein n=1 Tax=Eretmocerus hayati TaxID=131215 RepID=A0ACC2PX30_9HYME|nr:hypothetical protein QAD02_022993 [Eretmocerus hayati]
MERSSGIGKDGVAVSGSCVSKSKHCPEQARDELISILTKREKVHGRSISAFRLVVFYVKIRPFRARIPGPRLVILLALGAILSAYPYATNFVRSLPYRRCLMQQPGATKNLFRPAEDCSICQEVQKIEKISNIDSTLFEERYAYSGRPVVVTDATKNWTAMQAFSFAFFKELYKDQEFDCQFFPYKTGFQSLRDVFDMSMSRALLESGTEPWYVGWSNCDENIGSILREYYYRPYFLPDTSESEKTDWIFMGSPGYGAPMHVDDVKYPSWQAQIQGRKKWTLEPPRECQYSCTRLEVTVDSGEIIVLDTNKWYHQTLIVSEDISITIGAEYD